MHAANDGFYVRTKQIREMMNHISALNQEVTTLKAAGKNADADVLVVTVNRLLELCSKLMFS